MTVRDYSTTANDNATINGIALNDTMLANALDNAIRQAMADTANFLLDVAKPTSTTGSANAYILTTGGTVGAYVDKIRLAIRPNFSNTGACTINVDSVGVVDLKIYTSSGVGDPASGQIQSGGVYDVLYVTALGDFVVLNPTPTAHAIGDMVAANNLSDVASASTSFVNIKQAATETATGVVEKATAAEAEAGTEADKFPDVVAVAAAIAALGFNGSNSFTSSEQTITLGSKLSVAHGFGVKPKIVEVVLLCKTTDAPYAVGEEAYAPSNYSAAGLEFGVEISTDDTNVIIRTASNDIRLLDDSGGNFGITTTRWKYIVRAWL